MSVAAIPFPDRLPDTYRWFDDEPVFSPARHLALEKPRDIHELTEFGYREDEIRCKATPVAVSSPFRVLSPQGAEALLQVARTLRRHAVGCERIDHLVRGGCYRSRFLRDLCTDPSLTDLMCEIYRTDVAPHTMPVHLGHLNFSPDDPSRAVDKWHHDTLPLDAVMMVSDPNTLDGGRFEYFVGTKQQMARYAQQHRSPPRARIRAPVFPGPGYAIALHGDMVVHRGAPLRTPGERITLVNGYVATDTGKDDQHRHRDLTPVDDPGVLFTEWARHAAWRARGRLDRLLHDLEYTDDRLAVAARLEHAIADVSDAIAAMRDEAEHAMHHYEKP